MKLPNGWEWTTLGNVCDRAVKWDPRKSPSAAFEYIDIGAIDRQRITKSTSLLGAEAPSRARQLVKKGDTIVSTVRTYLVNTALVPEELDGATVSTGFCVLRPTGVIDSKFLFYRVLEAGFVASLSAVQTGSSYPAVRDSNVFAQPVALPPLAEQRRIVALLDERLSRLDAGASALVAVSARATQLRRSTLEDVFSRSAPKARVGDIAQLTDGPFGSNLKTSHYVASGPRVVRLQNIGDGTFRDEEAHITSDHYAHLSKHAVEPGDVVAASLGDDAPRACLVPEWLGPAIVKADCIRVRPGEHVLGTYLMWALNSPPVKRQAAVRIKGIGRPRLGLRGLSQLEVPLPPPEVQRVWHEEVDRVVASVATLTSEAEAALARARQMGRSVLARAFQGELVRQDPNDEPASVLLGRIAASRAAAQVKPRESQPA
jgi:type I restriction enzyme, S subunit